MSYPERGREKLLAEDPAGPRAQLYMPDIQVALESLETHTIPLLPVPTGPGQRQSPCLMCPSAAQDPDFMRQEVRMSSAAASPHLCTWLTATPASTCLFGVEGPAQGSASRAGRASGHRLGLISELSVGMELLMAGTKVERGS